MEAKPGRSINKIKSDAFLTVKVQPRSSENGISEIREDGVVKIKLTAPPVEGKANDALVNYLAGLFEVKRSDITIKSGQTSHLKVVKISNLAQEAVQKKIDAALNR